MKITLQQVQQNVGDIANRNEYTADVIYELLAAYGRSKSAITQLREGHLNKAEDPDAVLQKDLVYFRTYTAGTPLEEEVEKLYEDPLTQRYKPRYIIATDLTLLTAKDRIKGTNLAIKLADIDDHIDFFYWWTGDEVVDTKTEAVADRRAADKMNELYVEIEKTNRQEFINNPNFRHELNVFFTRLLFCYFAEDTGIYEDKQFTNAIKTYTQTDGSDLAWFFGELFGALDTKPEDNHVLKAPFKEFPYVNGSIFNTVKHAIAIPAFSTQARHLILECGRQNWGEINPDIFGVMFQGVVDPEHRDENGMDYTSVPNIMKVIQPLFLDNLQEEFDRHYDNEKKLWALLGRVQKIKVFDPACGSGNFLIIAYKEMRQLQHAIIGRIDELRPTGLGGGIPDNQLINIHNFYGIEIDDFAHELAVLSLFLAKHQMNQEFTQQFGKALSIIPLIDIPTIVRGNAARLDWQTVLPNVGHTPTRVEQSAMFDFGELEQAELPISEMVYDEIYLVGNPPYKGGKKIKNPSMKEDVKIAYKGSPYSKNVDYISIWFLKAGRYIRDTNAQFAFVSTNSVTQGEQISMIWPHLFDMGLEIIFAHTSFKWRNSARDQAGVTCVIVGLANLGYVKRKLVVTDGIQTPTSFINAYLVADGPNVIVEKRSMPLSNLPRLVLGSMPKDGGYLMMSREEKLELISESPWAEKFIKKFMGSADLIKGLERYCLWISEKDYEEALKSRFIQERINKVKEFRLESDAASTRDFARIPYRFAQAAHKNEQAIIIPLVSSESREYIPTGIVDGSTVVSSLAFALYGAEPWLFSIISSKLCVAWVASVGGKMETRYRFSAAIVYNNLPIPFISEEQKASLNTSARRILLARASHPEKTLAELYNPKKMPDDLRTAHDENDHLVDQLYKKGGFTNDEDRLAALFDLYEEMNTKEKTK